jgi:hypothetical protein
MTSHRIKEQVKIDLFLVFPRKVLNTAYVVEHMTCVPQSEQAKLTDYL